jgi:hypothetical protein
MRRKEAFWKLLTLLDKTFESSNRAKMLVQGLPMDIGFSVEQAEELLTLAVDAKNLTLWIEMELQRELRDALGRKSEKQQA